MEKFDHQEYRDNLAKDLKAVEDHTERREALDKEKESFRYDRAQIKHREESAEEIKQREENIAKLETLGCQIFEIYTNPDIKDARSAMDALVKAGFPEGAVLKRLGDLDFNIIDRMLGWGETYEAKTSNKPEKYRLAKITAGKLGISRKRQNWLDREDRVLLDELKTEAEKYGLSLGSYLLAPEIALGLKPDDLEEKDFIRVATEPMYTGNSNATQADLLVIARDGENIALKHVRAKAPSGAVESYGLDDQFFFVLK